MKMLLFLIILRETESVKKVMNSRLHFTKFMIKVLDVLIAKIKKH